MFCCRWHVHCLVWTDSSWNLLCVQMFVLQRRSTGSYSWKSSWRSSRRSIDRNAWSLNGYVLPLCIQPCLNVNKNYFSLFTVNFSAILKRRPRNRLRSDRHENNNLGNGKKFPLSVLSLGEVIVLTRNTPFHLWTSSPPGSKTTNFCSLWNIIFGTLTKGSVTSA